LTHQAQDDSPTAGGSAPPSRAASDLEAMSTDRGSVAAFQRRIASLVLSKSSPDPPAMLEIKLLEVRAI